MRMWRQNDQTFFNNLLSNILKNSYVELQDPLRYIYCRLPVPVQYFLIFVASILSSFFSPTRRVWPFLRLWCMYVAKRYESVQKHIKLKKRTEKRRENSAFEIKTRLVAKPSLGLIACNTNWNFSASVEE